MFRFGSEVSFLISDLSQLTEAQKVSDDAFIASAMSECITPLQSALRQSVGGFDEMDYQSRVLSLIELNNEVVGGDSLRFHAGSLSFCARSGGMLGTYKTLSANGRRVSFYEPWFVDEGSTSSNDNGQLSTTWAFLHGLCWPDDGHRYAVTTNQADMSHVEALPLPYRVALVALYVAENVNVTREEATKAILGCDELHSHRFYAMLHQNSVGKFNTWEVHMRDTRPSRKLGEYVASRLRQWSEEKERYAQFMSEQYGFDYESPLAIPSRRASDSRSELAFAYVDALIERGVRIGRGGDKTWNDVAAELVSEYGSRVRSYTGDGLRDCYRKRNQRRK